MDKLAIIEKYLQEKEGLLIKTTKSFDYSSVNIYNLHNNHKVVITENQIDDTDLSELLKKIVRDLKGGEK